MKIRIASLLLAASLHASAEKPTALFNGRDLSGWTFDLQGDVAPATVWSVEKGLLVCQGKPPGVIRTEKDYANYELVLEWRWAPGTKGGNSGLLIHASTPRARGIWPQCLEVQLATGKAGNFRLNGETIEPSQPPFDRGDERHIPKLTDDSEKPVGQWNTMRVRAVGLEVSVWVNGAKVNEGRNASATRGAICLQSEGAGIHFRKVELTPVE